MNRKIVMQILREYDAECLDFCRFSHQNKSVLEEKLNYVQPANYKKPLGNYPYFRYLWRHGAYYFILVKSN